MHNTLKKKSIFKRLLTFLTATILVLSFSACGSTDVEKNNLVGTWEVDCVEVAGSKFSLAELKALGDDNYINAQIVIKDGGKACLVDYSSSKLVDWEKTETGIKIGEQECSIIEGMICLDFDSAKLYFRKTSDSQAIDLTNEDGITDNDEENSLGEAESVIVPNENDAEKVTSASVDALTEIIEKDVADTIDALTADFKQLQTDIDTFDKYKQNVDKIEAFYTKVYTTQQSLNIRLREYSIAYAEAILASTSSNDDKYDDLDVIYDNIYDGVCEDIYDEIYDGILDEMYDVFYDGVLDDAYDTIDYSEWSDTCSNEYDLWSDTCSDVYDDWSDTCSDVYDFWSDIRSEVWDDDNEKAAEVIIDFQEDISKLKIK